MQETRILAELQDHDLRALRVSKQLDEIPEKRAILVARAKIAEIETLLRRSEVAARAIDAGIKRLEDEAAVFSGKIETEQAKLLSGSVTHPKELQAISLELSALKRRLDALENDVLAGMAKRDAATAQVARIAAAVTAGKAKEAELVSAFKVRGGSLIHDLDVLAAERAALSERLSPALRSKYETLREARHGIALGVLEGHTCSVCRVGMPAGLLDRLLSGPDVGECPMCHRMLIVRQR